LVLHGRGHWRAGPRDRDHRFEDPIRPRRLLGADLHSAPGWERLRDPFKSRASAGPRAIDAEVREIQRQERPRRRLLERARQLHVGDGDLVSLLRVGHGLAEEVDRAAESLAGELLRDRKRILALATGDVAQRKAVGGPLRTGQAADKPLKRLAGGEREKRTA